MGLFSITASAATATSGTTGDCTWSLDGTVLTISGKGKMGDYHQKVGTYAPWGTSITEAVIEPGVTEIGADAFLNCNKLIRVTIPDTIEEIGNCAFYNCNNLKDIAVPISVTYIDCLAFYNTGYFLNKENWDGGVLYIGKYLIEAEADLSGGYKIKEGTVCIANSAFRYCGELDNVIVPDSIKNIGGAAFSDCTNLKQVTLSKNISKIESSTFYNCYALASIKIPDSVESIEGFAFSYCKELKSVTMSDSVTSIGYAAFDDCSNLTSVILSNSLTKIENNAFYNCRKLTSIVLPESVTSIGNNAFNCLEKIYGYSIAASYADEHNLIFCSLNAPSSPQIKNVGSNYVILNENINYQYSIDGINWQNKNTFKNLIPNTEYKFYQRIYYSDIDFTTARSPALTVTTFKTSNAVNVSLKELPVYNGKEITPKLTVTLYGKELDENKDYELEYSNNVNAGNNAKVFVKGKGEYAVIRYEFCYPICVADISNAKITVSDEYYTGRKLKPVPKIEMNGVQLTEGVDFVLQYESNIEIGTAKVKVIGVGNYCGKTIAAFKIERKNTSTEYYKNVPFYNGDRKEITVLKGTVLEGIVQNIDKYSTLKPTYDIKEVLTFDPVTYKNVYTKKYTVSGVNSENKLNYTFNKTGTYLVTCVWEEVRCKYRYEYVNGNRVAILESETRTGIGQAGYIITVVEPETGTPDYPDTPQPPKQLVAGVPIVQGIRNIYLQPETNEENEKLSNVTWKSSDQEIATVDNGKITIKKSGKVIITASCNGKNAIWELEFEPLNLEKYGSILRYDSEKQTATVMFKNEVLIENVDYVLNKEKIGEMLIVTVRGINMFEGELCSAFYSANGNKYYCEHVYSSNTDTVCSLCHEKRKLPYTLGDLNNDNKINSLDGLLLLRYLNGWDVEIDSPNAMDINGDSKVNSLDGLLLLRYLNGWDIDLGEETDPTPPSGGETDNPTPPSEDDEKIWSVAEIATLKVSTNSIATDVSDFLVACVSFKTFISAGGVYGKEQATIKATEIKSSILKIRNQVNSLYKLVESRNDISYLDKDGKTYYLRQAYQTAKSITDNLYSRNISGTSTLAEAEEYVKLAQELWKACTLMNDIAKSV